MRSTLPADPPLAGPSGSFATFNANFEKMVFLAVWRIKTAEKRTFGKKHALLLSELHSEMTSFCDFN